MGILPTADPRIFTTTCPPFQDWPIRRKKLVEANLITNGSHGPAVAVLVAAAAVSGEEEEVEVLVEVT